MANTIDVADEVARRLEKLGHKIFDSNDILEALQDVVFVSVTAREYDGDVATASRVLDCPAIHESDLGTYFIQTRLTHPVQNADSDLIEDETDEEDEEAEGENEREVT